MARDSSAKWWQTLPGILTAIAASITAIAGLIAVLHQTGLLPTGAQKQSPTIAAPSAGEQLPATASVNSPPLTANRLNLILPENTQVKLPVGDGNLVYTLLSAQLEAYNSEHNSLKLNVRALNDYSYPANFWDRSFRLLIDGLAQAPANSLNLVLEAASAKEGEIVFIIPLNTQHAILKIGDPGQASTQIPLDVTKTKPAI